MSRKSSRPGRLRRIVVRTVSVLLVLAILLGAFGSILARRSFPQVDGVVTVAGLDGPVDIYRDSMGVPHIYADSLHDLFFAQGYVHAQDRFWQMDFWRHIGSGRLSEMFGESRVKTDAFLRTVGWRQMAEREWAELDPQSREILTAYADGVNAYLAAHQGSAVSLEYAVLGLLNPDYEPEPWTPIHSLTWGKVMAWDLGGNMDTEIERAILLATLTPEQLADLYPEYPADHPVIVPAIGEGAYTPASSLTVLPVRGVDYAGVAENIALMEDLLGSLGPGIGSNSWVVSGDRTATGMPLLANDPHLGIRIPSIWYQISLHCRSEAEGCFNVAGFSFAGVPGVVIGHNDNIAWGFTNVGPDVQDLYVERVNPENPNQYEVNGQWVDMELRTETIQVAGGEPVTITVRMTRHGPVVSDTYGSLNQESSDDEPSFTEQAGIDLPGQYVIALKWTALTEPSHVFDTIWDFNRAENFEQFRAAAPEFNVPAQNLLYADVKGNIGYQMPGSIPIRAAGDGSLPVPGWTDEYEWTGFIPFEELPWAYNPASGYIVTANNQVPPRDYAYLVNSPVYDYGFRAQRIVDMIENAPGPIDIAYIQQMQGDSTSLNAEVIVPILMSLSFDDPALADLRDRTLAGWDYRETADSQAALVFETFWVRLLEEGFADDLPEDQAPGGGTRWYEIVRRLVDQPESAWWDDSTTDGVVETRDDIFRRAWAEAVASMQEAYGRNPDRWPDWGDEHFAWFPNESLGQSGIAPVEALFNRGPFPTGGGESIVNATGWSFSDPFQIDWLPSMRMIVDLGDMRNSLTVHTTGQSGHAYHPHYVDMAPLWASVQYYPMLFAEQAIVDGAESHLRLEP